MFEQPLIKCWGDDASVGTSIVWLHGLGADCHDFVPLVNELNLPADHAVRFIFPNAPVRPVTINGGMRMRAWYDIAVSDEGFSTDAEHLKQSADFIDHLVQQQIKDGIPASRIFVAGFSQGGAVALYTGLRSHLPLAGVIALSTYLPLKEEFAKSATRTSGIREVFMAHGSNDPLIRIQRALDSRDQLQQMGVRVDWHEYAMAHSVCMEELKDLSLWLINRL